MTADQTAGRGALIQGGDGSIYFVPDAVLHQHVVTGDAADAISEALAGDEVAGFSMGTKLAPSSGDPISPLRAFEGTFEGFVVNWTPRAIQSGEPNGGLYSGPEQRA